MSKTKKWQYDKGFDIESKKSHRQNGKLRPYKRQRLTQNELEDEF